MRSCADSSPLATAIHRQPNWQRRNGARSRRAARLFQYVTKPVDPFGEIELFLPTRRRRFVDYSHVARGAQGQGLQTCRPDGHRLECLFSRSRLLEKAKLNPAHMVLTVLRRTLPSRRGSPTLCHRGNASGPERPHNARVSRPRICRGSSNAAPIEPT